MKNSMHMDNPKHPFTGGGGKVITPKTAHMQGMSPKPGGSKNNATANDKKQGK